VLQAVVIGIVVLLAEQHHIGAPQRLDQRRWRNKTAAAGPIDPPGQGVIAQMFR
jgi:hypothetical protein